MKAPERRFGFSAFFALLIAAATLNAVVIETLSRTVGMPRSRSLDALAGLEPFVNLAGFLSPLLAVIAVALIVVSWRRSTVLARFVMVVALLASISSASLFWFALWGPW
jgi:hypothetical protein